MSHSKRPSESSNLHWTHSEDKNHRRNLKRQHENEVDDFTNKRYCNPKQFYSSSTIKPTKNLAYRRLAKFRRNLEESKKSNLSSNTNCNQYQQNCNLNVNLNSKNNHNDLEQMEWSHIDETQVQDNINSIRKEINYTSELPQQLKSKTNLSSTGVLIVVDTNIFITHVQTLWNLLEKRNNVKIVIPWMVIQELDYLKESNSNNTISKAAQSAVRFIHKQLENNNSNFFCQSVMQAAKCNMSSNNADDGILYCCLQLVEQNYCVRLLSNDTNLRNKALIHNIPAYTDKTILQSLQETKSEYLKRDFSTNARNVRRILSNLLTDIVQTEMFKAYGDLWTRMAKLEPPLTLEESILCILKYWRSVFSFKLLRQCQSKVEELNQFLNEHLYDTYYDGDSFKKLMDLSLSLCIYLRNGLNYKFQKITDCIKNIERCTQ